MKCYRCTHKVGQNQFPVGVLPTSMADNMQCADPFNTTDNKVSFTSCDDGHCVVRFFLCGRGLSTGSK